MASLRATCARTLLTTLFLAAAEATHLDAQSGFAAVGGGASFPTGGRADVMRTGWVAELMAGTVLPGNFASFRVGGMFGESRVDPMMDGMGLGDPLPEGGTSRVIAGMAGLMAMPDWDWDWYPYIHASAGIINARFHGSATSFGWAAGAGAVMKWRSLDFYVESRFLQARRSEGSAGMGSVTSGVRLPF
jgi:hypothetical protein